MVKLALLWHMHQPYYEDLETGEHILPWVRFHAVKDYWGMVKMLEEFPAVRVTFNLVPSLLVQVEAFAEERARDRHLELGLKAAVDLGPDDASWLVANGFHAPYGRMVAPYRRYRELHAAKHAGHTFDVEALRDLQVWHKLVWMDPDLLARDERLSSLVEKGSHFSEQDKATLRAVELEIIANVIPEYRRAAARGQIELSTSPFYHPILPLLCDSDLHLRAHPSAVRLEPRFRRPEDARLQIRRALDYHETMFGQVARGMWPSEGSVSDEVVGILGEERISWIATDEDILARSLSTMLSRDSMGHAERPELLYRPYRLGDTSVTCLFRDHTLSDRIGFTYQGWESQAAAHDFVERVLEAGRRFSDRGGDGEAVVTVVLDGENAWEHYPGGGRPFLRALYGLLQESPGIQTITLGEAASTVSSHLPGVFPGSWINADFWIWIGHADDRRAWQQVAAARDEFDRRSSQLSPVARDRALVELLIAEGSDWCWWYGDDHTSAHDRDFDELFRRHLRNAYDAMGVNPPADLFECNITSKETTPGETIRVPGVSASPVLDGRTTSSLEWGSAIRAPLSGAGGAMHQVATSDLVTEVLVAITDSGLALRLSGPRLVAALEDNGYRLTLQTPDPEPRSLGLSPVWWNVDQLVELHVPRGALNGDAHAWNGRFAIAIVAVDGRLQERYPLEGYWHVQVESAVMATWLV